MQLPAAQLRIFEPVDALPERERVRWQAAIADGGAVTRSQAAHAAHRLSVAVQRGGALPREDLALVRRVRGHDHVCPLDLVLRAALAYGSLAAEHPPVVLEALVPDAGMRRRLGSLARSRRAPHIRDHAFAVPVAWYAAFSPQERRHTDPPEGRGPRTRFVTPVARARERVQRAASGLATVALDEDLDDIEDLSDWLAHFPAASLLELDYGPLAAALPAHQDRAAADVETALEAVEAGDLLAAAAALAAARSRWSATREQPEHS